MELRQASNKAIVVGRLMDMEVTTGVTKKGDGYISVTLIVNSLIDGKENENEIQLFATEKSKLHKSYSTIANEYKSAKLVGKENADRIRVDGELVFDKYVQAKTGKISITRKIRGTFVNRIDKPEITDEVGAEVECLVKGFKNETDKDGIETGRLQVDLLSIGYNNNVNEFQRVFVGKELASVFPTVYNIGDTAEFVLHVFNYSESKEETEEVEETIGFGQGLNNKTNSFKNYINEINLIGGKMPICDEGKFYTTEEVAYIKTLIELKNNELMGEADKKNNTSNSNNQGMAFGQGLGGGQKSPENPAKETIEDEDIPF